TPPVSGSSATNRCRSVLESLPISPLKSVEFRRVWWEIGGKSNREIQARRWVVGGKCAFASAAGPSPALPAGASESRLRGSWGRPRGRPRCPPPRRRRRRKFGPAVGALELLPRVPAVTMLGLARGMLLPANPILGGAQIAFLVALCGLVRMVVEFGLRAYLALR